MERQGCEWRWGLGQAMGLRGAHGLEEEEPMKWLLMALMAEAEEGSGIATEEDLAAQELARERTVAVGCRLGSW